MDKTWLIHKVLSGQASELEKVELSEWIASDPANKEDFEDIKFVMDSAKNVDERTDRNNPFYDGLRKIEGAIEVLKRKDKKIKLYKTLSLISLGLIFSFGIAAYIFDWHPYSKIQITTTINNDGNNVQNKILLENLKFDDDTLGRIIAILEKEYGMVVKVSTVELLSCRFTGTFYRGISIDDIVHTLSESIGFEYAALSEHNYEIRGKGCKA